MIKQIIINNMYMLKYVKKYCRFIFAMSFVNTLMDSFKQLYITVVIPVFLINAIANSFSFKSAILIICIYGIFILYESTIASYINSVSSPTTWNKLHEIIQKLLFNKALEADLKCYDDPAFYDNYLWTMNECDGRIKTSMNMLTSFLGTVLSLVLNFTVMITLTKMSMIFIGISVAISILVQHQAIKINFDLRQKLLPVSRRNLHIKNVLYNQNYAKEIRTTNIKNVVFEKMDENFNEVVTIYRNVLLKRISLFFTMYFNQIILLQFGLYIYIVYKITMKGDLSAGELVAISAAAMNAFSLLSSFSSLFIKMQENSYYVDKFKEFINYEPQIKEDSNGLVLEEIYKLKFNNISFTYPNTEKYALKNININVGQGEKIAIVGINGSGKTTLLKMLLRFYDPEIGEILVNGKNLKDYNVNKYRKIFGIIFQDFQCFSGTIAQNVLMRDIINEEEDIPIIQNALKKSGLYEKVNLLPLGIHTVLRKEYDDNGVVLSGGELQRLAIARIFAKDCKIVILDEPSSALDPKMEYEFYQLIFNLFKDRIVIFISHRLAVTKDADQVLMFDSGYIIESGSHEELMKYEGKYAKMYKAQEEKYR